MISDLLTLKPQQQDQQAAKSSSISCSSSRVVGNNKSAHALLPSSEDDILNSVPPLGDSKNMNKTEVNNNYNIFRIILNYFKYFNKIHLHKLFKLLSCICSWLKV